MRISSIQFASQGATKQDNIQSALALVERAQGSDLILLPEMWLGGYFRFDRYAEDAESIDGSLVQAFAAKARQLNAHILMGSFPERDGDQLFNTTVLLAPDGSVLMTYRKIHLFSYQSDERMLLSGGQQANVVQTTFGKVGLAICYDLRFPELFRHLVDQGAEIFLVVSAWPAARLETWRLFNRVRAAENLACLISCNAAGNVGGQPLGGHSMIVGPYGQVLAEGDETESIVSFELDPVLPVNARREFPALQERSLTLNS